MGDVTVLVLHPPLGSDAGPLTAALDSTRRDLAARHLARFRAAGAGDVRLVEEHDDVPFGARLRRLAGDLRTSGVVVLGSGAMPLARPADYRSFVVAAAAAVPNVPAATGAGPGDATPIALANNRYSADVIAVPRAAVLRDLPDLPGDNALPRWLEEAAGYRVADLRRRPRLGVDLDSPGDVVLLGWGLPDAATESLLAERLAAIRSVMTDRRSELTLAGRTSASALAMLERATACRIRALVEERGLRAGSVLAQSPGIAGGAGPHPFRPPRSVLGLLLGHAGPEALGGILAELGDAALVDLRVLLAHRLGVDDQRWPPAEERFAADLLLPERIADPWLRTLTESALEAPIPVVLGGHTLVGPGLRLLVAATGRRTAPGPTPRPSAPGTR